LKKFYNMVMIWLGNGRALRFLDGVHGRFNDFKGSSSATTGRPIGSTLTGVNMVLNGMDGQSKRLGQS
jgi:hypothetical protein